MYHRIATSSICLYLQGRNFYLKVKELSDIFSSFCVGYSDVNVVFYIFMASVWFLVMSFTKPRVLSETQKHILAQKWEKVTKML